MATNPLPRRPPRPLGSPTGGSEAPPPELVPPRQQPARSGPESRRKRWIAPGVLVGGFVLFWLFQIVPMWLAHDHDDDHGHGLPHNPQKAAYAALFQEAKNRIREHDWIEAKKLLLEARSLAPDATVLADYLAAAEREISNQQHLTAARDALESGALAKAKAELDAVDPSTSMSAQVHHLKEALWQAARENLRQAPLRLQADQRDQALALVKEAEAVFPFDPEAQRIYGLAKHPLPAPSPTLARFLAGDLPGALALARTCAPSSLACRTELAALEKLSTLYKKREKLGTEGLVRMVELDKQLAGTRSPTRLTHELITDLRNEAKELFLLCYRLKDTHPEASMKKFRRVMALTLPEDELHQKAKNWIDKLER